MEMIFAWDKASEEAKHRLKAWTEIADFTHYALVDMALLTSEQRTQIMSYDQWRPTNAYAETLLAGYGKYAPHLIALSRDTERRCAEIDLLLQVVANAPALSWLRSNAPRRSLTQRFGYLGKAQIEGESAAFHFRVADTRNLGVLLEQLTNAQQARVSQAIEGWGWVDRNGLWQSWAQKPSAEDPAAADSEPYVHISSQRSQTIWDAVEADIHFARLAEEYSSLLGTSTHTQLHRRIEACLNVASSLHIFSDADRSRFVSLWLEYGDDFHLCEPLTPTWASLREDSDKLVELSAEWPDELWAALKARALIVNKASESAGFENRSKSRNT